MAIPRMGRRELEIMNVVWDLGEATVREVFDRLPGRPAYTTVLTMMRSLEEKKRLLQHEERGRVYVYRATIPRQHVGRSLIADLRDLVFSGSRVGLITSLLNQEPLTDEERRDIEGIFRQVLAGNQE